MEAIDAVMQVNRIFKTKDWADKDTHELVFNGFCKLIDLLEKDQRELLIELTERYDWITQAEYQNKFIQAMESIDPLQLVGISKIFFFPIIKIEDQDKVKSGEHLLYMVKAYKQLMKKYSGIKFEFIPDFDRLGKLNLGVNERLFLVDDYIGSGETFTYCMEEVSKNSSLVITSIKLVCIAMQETTYNDLTAKGFQVLHALLVKRGISDFNHHSIIEDKKTLMREIERNIPGARSFSLGYNETEALITMMRTPDNTFPVFWKNFRKNGKYIEAPFARLEEI